MERVEAAQLLGQVVATLVRLRHHHHQRVRQRAAREHEQLEHVVEGGRVRPALADHRQQLPQVVAEELRGELRLARPHPVRVAAEGVDLAVVRHEPVRVRELPARERVGGVARVDEGERALDPLVGEVEVEALELRRREHALVDERPGGEARDDEVGAGLLLGQAPDHVELALERVLVEARGGRDDDLADPRHRGRCGRSGRGRVDRDVAPPDDALPLLCDDPFDQRLDRGPPLVLGREEAGADAVGARRRERRAELAAEEGVRELEQHPGSVAGVGVGPRGAAVLEVLERGQGAAQRLVRGGSVESGHEGDPARVVLVRRVVEAGCAGSVVVGAAQRNASTGEDCGNSALSASRRRRSGCRLARTNARGEREDDRLDCVRGTGHRAYETAGLPGPASTPFSG